MGVHLCVGSSRVCLPVCQSASVLWSGAGEWALGRGFGAWGGDRPGTLTLLVLRMSNMSCRPSVTSSSLYSSSVMELKSRRRLCTTEYRDWEKAVLRDSIHTCSFQGTPGPGRGRASSHSPRQSPPRGNPSLWQALGVSPTSAAPRAPLPTPYSIPACGTPSQGSHVRKTFMFPDRPP